MVGSVSGSQRFVVCLVLQDGNYRDFSIGDRRSFALEYWAFDGLRRATSQDVGLQYSGEDSLYDGCGELLYDGQASILDFGIRAYGRHQRLMAKGQGELEVGERAAGAVSLSVDPFDYFEHLATLPGIPPLIYDWTIEQIEMDTTPLITVQPGDDLYPEDAHGGGPVTIPDQSRRESRLIARTRMWDDRPDGAALYFLTCRREPAAPAHSLRRT